MSPDEAQAVAQRWESDVAKSDQAMPVKMAIMDGAVRLPAPLAVPIFEAALQDAEPRLRARACELLGRIADLGPMDVLIRTLGADEDTDVRLAAARSLGHYRDPQAIAALGALLDDRDPAVQYLAMQSLHQVTGGDGGHDVRRWKRLLEPAESRIAETPKTRR
jgi:HEAT repeat protein